MENGPDVVGLHHLLMYAMTSWPIIAFVCVHVENHSFDASLWRQIWRRPASMTAQVEGAVATVQTRLTELGQAEDMVNVICEGGKEYIADGRRMAFPE